MKHITWLVGAALIVSGAGAIAGKVDSGKAIAAALADPSRPAEDTARDAARHPAETIAFARIKPGDRVVDFIMGGGYFTRILAKTVGPKGQVYGFMPDEFIKFKPSYGTDQKAVAAAYANIVAINGPLGAPALPDKVDVAITVQNYHDMHLGLFPADTAAKANAALFKALKHGGTLLVIDHVAATGSGLETPGKLHRIDPAIIKEELATTGFRYDGELAVLRNPADDHSKGVFDPAIRGHTDQVIYRFVKP
ncbi:MAG: methyltransferase [Sphingomonas bacterium]|uniref:class I SAM-dependent methyltransferase n=1 Tax=Sphingomonas bacterium TaxID=1895847 RepID=UPI00261D7565|nr:methyltransferase [Sphingomonas bacterium]MDB5712454.1 methyltransferase [Sphingomonas bacterium]